MFKVQAVLSLSWILLSACAKPHIEPERNRELGSPMALPKHMCGLMFPAPPG